MKQLDISRALTIPGWMSEQELLWLAELGSRSLLGVEIGTYLGRSARAIADNTPNDARLICVEPFCDSEGIEHTVEEWQEIEAKCRKNLADSPNAPNVSIWNTTSYLAACGWDTVARADRRLDFVFIDGAHSYDGVKEDIESWRRKVRLGGIICGHDFGIWPGVEQAVIASFGKDFDVVGSIWYHTRKG